MMPPMLLMIVKFVVLLARRIVDLVLLLSWRIPIVFMLLDNFIFLASLWRYLSSLTLHASLESSFLYFFANCFF